MKVWSISAHHTFRRCQRQHFFQHVMASHNARDPNRREAHMLRQLRSLDEWRGHLVHLALERYFLPALKQGELVSRDTLTERTLAMAREQFSFSVRGTYKEPGVTKKAAGDVFLALHKHEYGQEIGTEEIDTLFAQIDHCYRFLYSHEQFLDLLRNGRWYSAEPAVRFRFGDAWVNAKLDLVMAYGTSELLIVDWKVGNSQTSDYSRQLRLYALAALQRWPQYSPEDLLLVEANLLRGNISEHHVSEQALLDMEDFIYRSVIDMQPVSSRRYTPEALQELGYANSPLSCEHCKFERMCTRLSG